MNEPPIATAARLRSICSEIARVSSRYWNAINVMRSLGSRFAGGVGPAPGCQQQRVVGIASAARFHDAFLRNDPLHARPQMQVDPMLLVPREVADHHLRFRNLFAQHRWQRNPIVKRVGLVAEEHDLARRVVLAQLLRRGRAGKAVADDHVPALSHGAQFRSSSQSRPRARARRYRSARCAAARRLSPARARRRRNTLPDAPAACRPCLPTT